MKDTELIQSCIIRDMSEGVISIGFDGTISFINPAAEGILSRKASELVGQSFAAAFIDYDENDSFNQVVLNAVYDRDHTHESIVDFYDGTRTKQLHVTTSFLRNEKEAVGIVCVLTDVSELNELRDALRAMERIKAMNTQLSMRNKLLSETFGRYLSDEIVQQLLDTPDGLSLGGKKRVISIMMADIRGFTPISEKMDAQSLLDMLNHYLGVVTPIIEKYNGSILELLGDGIMAIFGAPLVRGNHADNAIAAAVEMQMSIDAINQWNRERNYPVLQIGIGIASGEVVVGNIGSSRRTKYGVIGSQVNLAGRIESYTVGGQILISPETEAMAASPLNILSRHMVTPKGVGHTLTLGHVIGIGAPYDLQYTVQEEPLQKLSKPVSIRFRCIYEKHMEQYLSEGVLSALGRGGAILKTDIALEPFLNLELDIGGELFAKVLQQDASGGWTIRFTSFPVDFNRWYESVIS